MGLEPTTFGTTNRHSNRLNYILHVNRNAKVACLVNIPKEISNYLKFPSSICFALSNIFKPLL